MRFTKAIVRKPGKSYPNGITTSNLGKPDYQLALKQHQNYCKALQDCGLQVITLEALEQYPDSCFVEDTAVVTEKMGIISRPGDERRRGEETIILPELEKHLPLEKIEYSGTLDGGDILQIKDKFYIGISDRTNLLGAEQFGKIVQKYGYKAITVNTGNMLHLKTGVNYLGNNVIIVQEAFANNKAFEKYEKIIVDPSENYAANSLKINDYIIVPKGFNKTIKKIKNKGFTVVELNVSEFEKMDGGLSCLSLRF